MTQTRSEARDQILRTLTRLKQFLNQPSPPPLSEADTKAYFVEPHVAALGYEGFEDISREYYVRSSHEFGPIFEQLWLLSKESMAAPTAIRSWMEWRRLDRALRRIVLNPLSAGVRALVTELQAESVEASADDVADWFRQQLIAPEVSPVTAVPPPQEPLLPPTVGACTPYDEEDSGRASEWSQARIAVGPDRGWTPGSPGPTEAQSRWTRHTGRDYGRGQNTRRWPAVRYALSRSSERNRTHGL